MKALVVALALLVGCSPAGDAAPETDAGAKDCSGKDPENGCDDCNPCTVEYYCESCAEVDSGPCSQPADLPPFCAGMHGCTRYNRTTPEGQSNDCFPAAGSNPPEAGECSSGVCK